MTTEREMLEYAAKACGIKAAHYDMGKGLCVEHVGMGVRTYWNPLTNSADCAAMCAKLSIDTDWYPEYVDCSSMGWGFAKDYPQPNNDQEAAWRYAATMVAAKIGGMK